MYNVLAMGLLNATDIFEACMRNIVDGLKGVINIADDILLITMYSNQMLSFLDCCVEHDLHLNPNKV